MDTSGRTCPPDILRKDAPGALLYRQCAVFDAYLADMHFPATVTLSLGTIPASLTSSAVLRITGAGIERFVQVYYRQPP